MEKGLEISAKPSPLSTLSPDIWHLLSIYLDWTDLKELLVSSEMVRMRLVKGVKHLRISGQIPSGVRRLTSLLEFQTDLNVSNEVATMLPPSLRTLVCPQFESNLDFSKLPPALDSLNFYLSIAGAINTKGFPNNLTSFTSTNWGGWTAQEFSKLPRTLVVLRISSTVTWRPLVDEALEHLPRDLEVLDLILGEILCDVCIPLLPRMLRSLRLQPKLLLLTTIGLSRLPPLLTQLDLPTLRDGPVNTLKALEGIFAKESDIHMVNSTIRWPFKLPELPHLTELSIPLVRRPEIGSFAQISRHLTFLDIRNVMDVSYDEDLHHLNQLQTLKMRVVSKHDIPYLPPTLTSLVSSSCTYQPSLLQCDFVEDVYNQLHDPDASKSHPHSHYIGPPNLHDVYLSLKPLLASDSLALSLPRSLKRLYLVSNFTLRAITSMPPHISEFVTGTERFNLSLSDISTALKTAPKPLFKPYKRIEVPGISEIVTGTERFNLPLSNVSTAPNPLFNSQASSSDPMDELDETDTYTPWRDTKSIDIWETPTEDAANTELSPTQNSSAPSLPILVIEPEEKPAAPKRVIRSFDPWEMPIETAAGFEFLSTQNPSNNCTIMSLFPEDAEFEDWAAERIHTLCISQRNIGMIIPKHVENLLVSCDPQIDPAVQSFGLLMDGISLESSESISVMIVHDLVPAQNLGKAPGTLPRNLARLEISINGAWLQPIPMGLSYLRIGCSLHSLDLMTVLLALPRTLSILRLERCHLHDPQHPLSMPQSAVDMVLSMIDQYLHFWDLCSYDSEDVSKKPGVPYVSDEEWATFERKSLEPPPIEEIVKEDVEDDDYRGHEYDEDEKDEEGKEDESEEEEKDPIAAQAAYLAQFTDHPSHKNTDEEEEKEEPRAEVTSTSTVSKTREFAFRPASYKLLGAESSAASEAAPSSTSDSTKSVAAPSDPESESTEGAKDQASIVLTRAVRLKHKIQKSPHERDFGLHAAFWAFCALRVLNDYPNLELIDFALDADTADLAGQVARICRSPDSVPDHITAAGISAKTAALFSIDESNLETEAALSYESRGLPHVYHAPPRSENGPTVFVPRMVTAATAASTSSSSAASSTSKAPLAQIQQELVVDDETIKQLPATMSVLEIPNNSTLSAFALRYLPSSLTVFSLISNQNVDDEAIALLPRGLTNLVLGSTKLTDRCASDLPRGLLELGVRCNFSDAAISHLPRTLKILGMGSNTKMTDAGVAHLPPALERLNLMSNLNLTDNAIGALPRTLLQLNLYSNTNMTDRAMALLPRDLTYLNLSGDEQLSDVGVAHLPPSLIELIIVNNLRITDKGMLMLPRTLTHLRLRRNTQITGEGLAALPVGMRSLHITASHFTLNDIRRAPHWLLDCSFPHEDAPGREVFCYLPLLALSTADMWLKMR